MGFGFVLLIWVVVGFVCACIGAAVLVIIANLITRKVTQNRKKLFTVVALFPFASLVWGGAVFVFQAIINESVLNRDLGIGDTWHCPLPNGYHLLFIDVTDSGWVYNPKTQGTRDGVGEQEDAVPGVRWIQISGRYILGSADSKYDQHFSENTDQTDEYFLLDTQTGKRANFSKLSELRVAAAPLGIQLNFERVYAVYSRYRFTWFDVFAGLLFVLPPFVIAGLIVWWIVRLRRTSSSAMQVA